MIRTLLLTSVLSLAITAFQPALAGDAGVDVVFTQDEIRIISAWYQDHNQYPSRDAKNNKGGKSRGLPPGISKNLARGKPLPRGIAMQQLPSGLSAALPPSPGGYKRVIVDGKVLLVEIATQVVHDVLSDAVLR
jgi:hypothetical protein